MNFENHISQGKTPVPQELIDSRTRERCLIAYDKANFVLFPLHTDTRAPFKGWQSTLETPDKLPETYGILIPRCVFVYDFDPRRGADQLAELRERVNLPDTFTVGSPRGGVHMYYQFPEADVRARTKLSGSVPGLKAIEIKQYGQYVVGAGSFVETETHSGYYMWLSGDPCALAVATTEMLEANKRIVKAPVLSGQEFVVDEEAAQTRFIIYLTNVDKGESAYRIACEGVDYGLSANVIAQLMFDYLNPRWEEPAELETLRGKAINAYKFCQNTPGARSLAQSYSNGLDMSQYAEIVNPSPAPASADQEKPKESSFIKWDTITVKGVQHLEATMQNVLNFFRLPELRNIKEEGFPNPLYHLLRYNELSHRVEFERKAPWHSDSEGVGKSWHDHDAIQLKAWLNESQHFKIHVSAIEEAVVVTAKNRSYNPVRVYLERIKDNWDGAKRLETWLIDFAGCADTPYVRECGRVTMLGAVARAYRPGWQHDTMLILEGKEQGKGKTNLVRAIGGAWASEMTLDPHDSKKNVHRMLGKWIIELPELEFTRHADVKAVKAFLTIAIDNERLSFERHNKDYPRGSVFIATTNVEDKGYLRDMTGNRRFLPVATSEIDVKGFLKVRDQILSEAVQRFQGGEKTYTTDKALLKAQTTEQRNRLFYDIWEDAILVGLRDHPTVNKDGLTSMEVASDILLIPRSKQNRETAVRINYVMQKLGYEKIDKWSKIYRRSYPHWVKIDSEISELESW